MAEWQRCPVCNGSGIDPFVAASTCVPTRFTHPCFPCTGAGVIRSPQAEDGGTPEWLKHENPKFTET